MILVIAEAAYSINGHFKSFIEVNLLLLHGFSHCLLQLLKFH
jgi:hypothetical protein